jgi:hypothetical protein
MDFNAILKSIEGQTKALAQKELKGFADQALSDVKDFAQRSKADLELWTQAALQQKIPKDEYTSLVKGQLDLAEMRALKQAGLAQVRIDTFTNGFLEILSSAVMSAIPI